jgi:predicted MarR family transcription regulator
MTALLKELEENGLICRADAGGARSHQLTSTGCDVLTRLIDARRAHLADLIAEWPTEQRRRSRGTPATDFQDTGAGYRPGNVSNSP